jgi:Flp pilus assembly protein TadB
VIAPLALGALAGVGLLVVVRALWIRPVPLVDVLTVLDRRTEPRSSLDEVRRPFGERAVEQVAPWLVAAARRRSADLRVTDRTPQRHAAEKLASTLAGIGLPPLLAVVMAAGGVAAPLPTVLLAALALGFGGWMLPDLSLRDAAARRRRQLRHALSSYLDLVDVVLAGGAGVETALEAAADAGGGWAFGELRTALARSRVLRRSPWSCFAELGDELGVVELVELAASVRLAGEQGARIRSSLSAKAASLRGHQLAEVEAAAQSASERMAVPTVLMFAGFLLFIGFPAVAEILGGSGW